LTRRNKIKRYFSKKAQSKKGFTLVEAAASVMILAIVCAGVLNAVAFSREMVYSNNAREKASDKAQLVADEIVSAAMGEDPANPDTLDAIKARVNEITNADNGTTPNVQAEAIGKVACVTAFSEPTSDDELIQYTITPITAAVNEDTDIEVVVDKVKQKVTVHEAVVEGWDIHVRVYYKQIGAGGAYRVVDMDAFAPKDYAPY